MLPIIFQSLLSLCPENILDPRFCSGATNLRDSRPVSQARQLYDTNPSQYPLTQPIPKVEALVSLFVCNVTTSGHQFNNYLNCII